MSKSKQSVKNFRSAEDRFERQKIRHIKHEKKEAHLQELVDDDSLISDDDHKSNYR